MLVLSKEYGKSSIEEWTWSDETAMSWPIPPAPYSTGAIVAILAELATYLIEEPAEEFEAWLETQ